MNRSLLFKLFLPVLLLPAFSTVSAQVTVEKAGVCLLDYDNEDDSVIANGVSSAFFETITGIRKRRIEKEEILGLLAAESSDDITEKRLAIEKLYSERDRLLFTADKNELASKLAEKDLAIEKAGRELEDLLEQKTDSAYGISPGAYADIEIQAASPDDGPLYSRTAGAVSETASANDLDLVVYGRIERIDEYRYIELRLWNQVLMKDILVWRTAAGSTELTEQLRSGIKKLKTALIGKEWAEITVKSSENSMIYVNGNFSGIGKINNLLIEPGEVQIMIKKKGYETLERKLTVAAYESPEYSFDLQQLSVKSVIIQSFPAGADVYLDSVWIGPSPQKIEMEEAVSSVTIRKEGYDEMKFLIDDSTENIVNVDLKPLTDGRSEYITDRRNRFYASMGGFILSLPATSLLYGMVEQTASAYNREIEANGTDNYDELLRIENLNRAQYSLYLASIGMNIFLLLDTIIQAADYVGSVEYFSN